MTDFASARRTMIDCQVRTADVTDSALLDAMDAVPRELFVPEGLKALSYLDRDVALGGSRYLMAPMVLAKLLQAAEIKPSDNVLDVGAATGYAAAILAQLAGSVVGLESDASLAAVAKSALAAAGAASVEIAVGPLDAGWAKSAPYDLILIEGSIETIPDAIAAQLKPAGRLVAVVGQGRSARATVSTKLQGELSSRRLFDAAIPPLPGFARPPAFAF